MKNFKTILTFELKNYFENKTFLISTILISVVAIVCMFIPRFSDVFGEKKDAVVKTEEIGDSEQETITYDNKMIIFDPESIVSKEMFSQTFPQTELLIAESKEDVIEMVESNKAKAGFVMNSATNYEYYVFNKGLYDSTQNSFYQMIQVLSRMEYCSKNNLDYDELEMAYHVGITSTVEVLGKDAMSNYWYCYGLVIIVFMLIIFYGIMIATSVTTEKSNRSIEVLVTSTNPTSLLFGKVFAGAIASLLQASILLGSVLGSYQFNRDAWGSRLDMIFNIPAEVLITFAFFGLGGYLFYAFIYGMVGALVSKTEDINKSAGSIQMIIMIVYFVVLFQLQNIDGIAIKIASFLPISSYSAMFARVAMGKVEIWEIIISFIILVVSIIGIGIFGAKVYRSSTLRYGNPIKLRTILKSLKNKE